MTVIIQIGNSDNKLTQEEWSEFVKRVDSLIRTQSPVIHFFGGNSNWERWQNTAWIFELFTDETLKHLTVNLFMLKKPFKQDSIAMTVGNTEMI